MRILKPDNDYLTKTRHEGSLPHKHVMWEVVIFIEGKCLHHIQNKTIEVDHGDLFIVGPQHIHNIETIEEPHYHRDIYFTDTEFKQLCDYFKMPNLYNQICNEIFHTHLSEPLLQHLLKQLKTIELYDIINTTTNNQENCKELDTCRSIRDSILLFLLSNYATDKLSQNQTDKPNWILDILLQLNSPSNFVLKPLDIIKRTGYSHSRFSELFKQYVGVSLSDYMIEKKLQYATNLLTNTNKSLLDICYTVGYDSYSCFVRMFKKRFGISPLKYKQLKLK